MFYEQKKENWPTCKFNFEYLLKMICKCINKISQDPASKLRIVWLLENRDKKLKLVGFKMYKENLKKKTMVCSLRRAAKQYTTMKDIH